MVASASCLFHRQNDRIVFFFPSTEKNYMTMNNNIVNF